MMKSCFKLSGGRCPQCGGRDRYSAARSRNWKLVFFVRGWSCRNCHSQYMVLFGRFSVLIEQGFRSVLPDSDRA